MVTRRDFYNLTHKYCLFLEQAFGPYRDALSLNFMFFLFYSKSSEYI